MKRNQKKIEFKKIGFLLVSVFSLLYIISGRIAEVCGLIIDTSVDVSLVYTVLGAFVAYCAASASDKRSANKYGIDLSSNVQYEVSETNERGDI